ncbi:unnamed protein product [Parnassius apollo]|uniref:(apollo) hypothetical protein n=1 Tax=Parnassius apollo TaxID=110799 RepID=A0A8S3XN69_PARAO|nr:unnamed protein product [Parnassius apollo]
MTELLRFEEVESIEEVYTLSKYPKTDYTYSRLSRDRVELAPGQVAVPNMSRRSLSQFRVQGPHADTTDLPAAAAAWTTTTVRKRYTTIDSSDDETAYLHKGTYNAADNRWWLTRLLVTVITTITTATSNTYRKIVGPSHRYPYTDRRPAKGDFMSRAATTLGAPFYWIYSVVKTLVTTTVTTVTETIMPNHVGENEKYMTRSYQSKADSNRRMWPWILLLLLPMMGYGLNYTYKNFDHLAMPNFTDFQLDLSEFYASEFPKISWPALPNISLSELNVFPRINLTLPEINITLPDVTENLPQVSKAYREYKDIVQNRMTDASDYLSVVAGSCYEEMKRFWRGVIG